MFFNKMSLRLKMMASFGLLILLLAGCQLQNYYTSVKVQELAHVEMLRAEDQRTAQDFKSSVALLYSYQADLIINDNEEMIEEYRREMNNLNELLSKLESSASSGEESVWVEQMRGQAASYSASFDKVLAVFRAQSEMTFQEVKAAYRALDDETDGHKEELFQLIGNFSDSKQASFLNAAAELQDSLSSNRRTTLIMLPVLIGIGQLLSSLLSRALVRPIRRLAEAADRIAAGDLTLELEVRSSDEIGRLAGSFGQMVQSLKLLIREAGETSRQVSAAGEELTASSEHTAAATGHIAQTMQKLAADTEDQADRVKQVTRSIDEMSTQVNRITEDAAQVVSAAGQAEATSSSGLHAVTSAVSKMEAVHETVEGMSAIIRSLSERSKEITGMNAVIRSIAAQTNMLALNAGIEAARAGEQGRGFAIVAAEIRRLAEQSSASSEGVGMLISSVLDETGRAVSAMAAVTSEIDGGMEAVRTAGESFTHIQGSIEEVSRRIRSVDRSIQDIAGHTSGMVGAVSHLSQSADTAAGAAEIVLTASEEQLASMQEISSATVHLSSMADDLSRMLHKFKV